MMQHKRTPIVNVARRELMGFFLDLEKKYKLTYEDMFVCLGDRLDAIASGIHDDLSLRDTLARPYLRRIKPNAKLTDALFVWHAEMRRIQEVHKLTYGEWFSILGGEIAGLAKYLIRTERHPNDPDKGGDEA